MPFLYLGLLLGTAIFLFQAKSFSRAIFFLFLTLGFLLIAVERLLVRALAARGRRAEAATSNLLLVGINPDAIEIRRPA